MQDPEHNEMVEYWSQAGTASGRWRLTLRFWRKRVMWRLVVGLTQLLKRIVDVVLSGCALLALSPVFAITALLIKLEDRGPIFFQQKRVGRDGALFGMWKFRSMVPNADKLKDQLIAQNEMKGGITFKMKNDPRITRVGRFIRKYSVDELPQFWNVFVGDMSLVGPRPERPEFNGQLAEQIPWYDLRHLSKPGLTGWAQVRYPYGASVADAVAKLEFEIYYLKRASTAFDLRILLRTIAVVVGLRGR